MKKFFSVLLSLILIGAILYSGYNLEKIMNDYRVAKDISTEVSQTARKGRNVDFDALLKRNSDVKGWIYIKDTQVDYPILQYGEIEEGEPFYIHRDIDKNYLYDGSIFIDSAIEKPFEDFNTIIYGHRMLSGAMFHNISKFLDKDFFDSHPIVIVETPSKSYDLHVIAFLEEDAFSELYTVYYPDNMELIAENSEMPETDLNEFSYNNDEDWFSKRDFVELVKNKAVNISDEEFDINDKFVTLSTCKYADSDARQQLICTVQEPTKETKTTITEKENPFMNYWLAGQIGVGIIMAVLIILLIPKPKRKKK